MKKSELKQLIREVIEEYKSNDKNFWAGAAQKAKEKAIKQGGTTAGAQAKRFADYAEKAKSPNERIKGKKFQMKSALGWDSYVFEMLDNPQRLSRGGGFAIKFRATNTDKKEAYTGYITLFDSVRNYGELGIIVGEPQFYFKLRNDRESALRVDRNGAIIFSKISGLPASEYPLI